MLASPSETPAPKPYTQRFTDADMLSASKHMLRARRPVLQRASALTFDLRKICNGVERVADACEQLQTIETHTLVFSVYEHALEEIVHRRAELCKRRHRGGE